MLYPNLKGCNYLVPTSIVEVWMEANFIQDLLLDEFVEEGARRGWQLFVRPDHRAKPDKYTRIESLTPIYERGMVYFNEAEKGNRDMQTGLEQILAIEPGSNVHDDAPDADEGAIYKLQSTARQSNSERRISPRPSRSW
jgi:predicted phage terminase large subunit-like protein